MALAAEEYNNLLYINNEFVPSTGSERLTLTNPWDDSTVATDIHVANAADIDAAVAASKHALKNGPWKTFAGDQRAAAMHKFADLVEQNAERLARLESLPSGRPVSMIRHFDIVNLVITYRYFAGWADKIAGRTFREDNGIYKLVRYEPIGVCAGIASFNATMLYVALKIAPAVAAGNTFIFKASEKTPLGALALAPLFAEAGFPPGVVQFVSGGASTGALLASHMDISKISFTGSANGGRAVQALATKSNMKRVTLELGGKSPAIVFDDAPLAAAIASIGHGFLFNSGQICVATSRVLVHEDIAPAFVDGVKKAFESVNATLGGNPLDPATTHGPVVDRAQFDSVMGYIALGRDSAELVTGGDRKGTAGCAIQPTIFLNPQPGSRIWDEEIFGPVLSVKTFKTEEEAIELANASSYGLSASIFTLSLPRALRVSSALESGTVGVNAPFIPEAQVPFGGVKQSGTGRELGEEGLKEYLETKTISISMSAVA